MEVVLHINQLERWPMVINNARNLRTLAPQTIIEILANGEAVKNYFNLQEKHFHALEELADTGIVLIACQNSLHAFSLNAKTLPPFVSVVPAVVMTLVEKQQQGYAYIKP